MDEIPVVISLKILPITNSPVLFDWWYNNSSDLVVVRQQPSGVLYTVWTHMCKEHTPHVLFCASVCHLEELIVSHVGSQASERLTATATHAHQEGVALGVLNDTTDAVHMFDGKSAEDKRSTVRRPQRWSV